MVRFKYTDRFFDGFDHAFDKVLTFSRRKQLFTAFFQPLPSSKTNIHL